MMIVAEYDDSPAPSSRKTAREAEDLLEQIVRELGLVNYTRLEGRCGAPPLWLRNVCARWLVVVAGISPCRKS